MREEEGLGRKGGREGGNQNVGPWVAKLDNCCFRHTLTEMFAMVFDGSV